MLRNRTVGKWWSWNLSAECLCVASVSSGSLVRRTRGHEEPEVHHPVFLETACATQGCSCYKMLLRMLFNTFRSVHFLRPVADIVFGLPCQECLFSSGSTGLFSLLETDSCHGHGHGVLFAFSIKEHRIVSSYILQIAMPSNIPF